MSRADGAAAPFHPIQPRAAAPRDSEPGADAGQSAARGAERHIRSAGPAAPDPLTHFNTDGRARMVDVGGKPVSARQATAGGSVWVNAETFDRILAGTVKKGDVLAVSQTAGIMGAKRTPDLIPMCHPLLLTGVDIRFEPDASACRIDIEATVRCSGQTGVEMEALTAVSAAALTIYDMCKAMQRDIRIGNIRLLEKQGGKSGSYRLIETAGAPAGEERP